MRIPGKKKLVFASRWLGSRFADRALILGYHRIADEDWDPFSLSVSRAHFLEHLAAIRRFGTPMRLREIAASLDTGTVPHRAIALTFDDGYADIVHTVKPLLEQHQIPATVFVVSGNIGREFWWDELTRIISPADVSGPERSIDIEVGNRVVRLELPCRREACTRHMLELQSRLQSAPPHERTSVLEQIRGGVGYDGQANPPLHRCVDGEELAQLAASPFVDIGAHTHWHVELGRLAEAQQEYEITESRRVLEEAVGRTVDAFSYPHGSVPPAARRTLERLGFQSACTSIPNVVLRGSDRLQLPRLWVSNVDGETFSRQLRTWLGSPFPG